MIDTTSHAGVQHFCKTISDRGFDTTNKIGLVIGFGEGHEANYLSRELGTKIIGIDKNLRIPEGEEVIFLPVLSSALQLPYPNNSFDFIFYHHVIEHVPDARTSLLEIDRVLRPGGLLYIGTPNRHRIIGYIGAYQVSTRRKIRNNIVDYKARLMGKFSNEQGAHAGFSKSELEQMLLKHYINIDWLTSDYLHYKYKSRIPRLLLSAITSKFLLDITAPSIYVLCNKPHDAEHLEYKIMNILGINMDCLSYEDMYPLFDKWLEDKSERSHSIALINVNCCVSSLFDKKLRCVYNNADLVGIDSMPFLYWARTFYHKGADQFYAPDLMFELSSSVKNTGYTFFLYGGYPDAPEKMEQYLHKHFEEIQVVGKYSPPFRPLTDEEDEAICDMINSAHPDIIWVGLGSPKQDIWINDHREKIRGTIMIASGATFDFFSGNIKQAPKWIRNIGFEWLYRLTKDFRRLWKRYTIYNIVFMVAFVLQLLSIIKFDNHENTTKRR